MPSYRFPILIWEHFGGGFTACLVEDNGDIAAVALTRAVAAEQIKDLLQWRYRQMAWLPRPDFVEPELKWIKVEVRPEYAWVKAEGRAEISFKERVMPCRETVTLRVPCVRGKDSVGLLQCAIPTLGIRFNYDEEKSLAGLVGHYVQMALKGLTPQKLARHLPPAGVELDDVVIQLPKAVDDRAPEADVKELSAVAELLGARAARTGLSRPWQRDAEVGRLVQMLTTERASILLLGESGSGKTALLMEAVRKVERTPLPVEKDKERAVKEEEESKAGKKRFWLTSASRLISGMQYLGQWQQRIENIITELAAFDGILCVESLLDLVRTGGEGPNDSIAAFLIPYLQRGELRLIGEVTPSEIDACRRLLPAFAGLFQVLELPRFSQASAVAALDQMAAVHKQNLKIDYDRGTINQIYKLFSRFMPYQSFPGPAAAFVNDLFDHAARAQKRFNNDAIRVTPSLRYSEDLGHSPKNPSLRSASDSALTAAQGDEITSKQARITDQLAIDRFVKLTGLPELFLRDDRVLQQADVIDAFQKKVMGQENACAAAASVVTTFKAGLNDPARPLGVLLFCGPTGVGKTELAKTISQFLFGHGDEKDRMVRLDMSEYSGFGAAERLVGSPTGEPSDLIKRLRQQPFTVLLLDEIEKAAPEVFDMLLGVFDEGRLTDRYGRLTIFRSALIIMTSNLGADRMTPFGLSKLPPGSYDTEAMAFFRPEFFNRIDTVVTFDALQEATVREIAMAELQRIGQREGLARSAISIEWSKGVVNLLVEKGFDRRYGARPLQRAIEELIVTPLARFLIAQRPALRSKRIGLDVSNEGRVTFAIGG